MLKEYGELIGMIVAIFALLLVGALFSPTFEEKMSFWMLLFNLSILLFAFGLLFTLAYIGFSSFALYGAVVTAIILAMFGVYGVMLAVGMTYMIWGFIFGFEVLLVGHKVLSAEEWFKGRYSFESFYLEYRIFYPMIIVVYTIVEILPSLLGFEKPKRFKANDIVERMREILR
jgi:Mg2+/Co2+ transporter CorB